MHSQEHIQHSNIPSKNSIPPLRPESSEQAIPKRWMSGKKLFFLSLFLFIFAPLLIPHILGPDCTDPLGLMHMYLVVNFH